MADALPLNTTVRVLEVGHVPATAEAPHLGVAVGSALLAVRRLIHDEHGRPVQWLHGLYRPDRHEYQMQLSRAGDIAAEVGVRRELSAQFH